MSSENNSVLALRWSELEALLQSWSEPLFRAKQICQWIYEKRAASFEDMTNLPAPLRTRLRDRFSFREATVIRQLGSHDSTLKILSRLADGHLIETVLIPASPALYGLPSDRKTACVSTQVGCAYGCKFCASGLDGFTRNLHASEIVEQIFTLEEVSGHRVNNVVFMGMGEPLANFEQVKRAIDILNAPWGLGIGARHITISTSGLAPKIRELAQQPWAVRLAVSLHGVTDEVRSQIMPINRRFPVRELLDACHEFERKRGQRITFEYILIAGLNDSLAEARQLGEVAKRLRARINLIPYNRVEGLAWERPSDEQQQLFLAAVQAAGGEATIRREKGHDIAAACGQLRLQTGRDKSFAAGPGVS